MHYVNCKSYINMKKQVENRVDFWTVQINIDWPVEKEDIHIKDQSNDFSG